MRHTLTSLVAAAMLALVACGDDSKPGGPGVTKPNGDKPIVGQTDNTFTLDVPNTSTDVVQGETKTITIDINRGTNFDQDVNIEFGDVPKGVTLEPKTPVLKHGEDNVKVTVTAAADAALGDFEVKVLGKPGTGPTATSTLKIGVSKRE